MVNHCCLCSKSAPIAQSFGLCEKFYRFLKNFSCICLQVQKFALPLHSLSESNAVTRADEAR